VKITSDLNITTTFDDKVQENVKDENSWLYLNTELGIRMKIRFFKKHLNMVITKCDGLTDRAEGLI